MYVPQFKIGDKVRIIRANNSLQEWVTVELESKYGQEFEICEINESQYDSIRNWYASKKRYGYTPEHEVPECCLELVGNKLYMFLLRNK